jgi:transmembrane sensor
MTRFVDAQLSDVDQAAAWIARLRAPDVGAGDYEAFALWLAGSIERRQAFDAMADLWTDLAVLNALPVAPPERPRRRWLPALPRWSWGAIGAACAGLLVAVLLLVPGEEPGQQRMSSAVGAHEALSLADGSRVELNTDSSLTVRFDDTVRRLEIERGEAFFEVASDPDRPFRVSCGAAEAVAVGTAFNLRCDTDVARLTVTEGRVRFGYAGDRQGPIVEAGEHLLLDLATGEHRRDDDAYTAAVAWREWNLVFEDTPLIQVITELQRYTDTPIRITDSATASLRVSGVFDVRRAESVVEALAGSLPIEARRSQAGQILLVPAES